MGQLIGSGAMDGKLGCGGAGAVAVVLFFVEPVPQAMEVEIPPAIIIKIRA
ncbi:MAG TPA: hypothetical protein VKQ11_04630 [Candidatus Sulfotelmatobacter sp.]|nr:hypothetical protein [Candidatus Sulfotelmatobacter sp.]